MKRIKLIAVILIAFTTISYGATYSLVSAAYPINVNGQKIAVQPLNLNGTTYLPLRSISEAVGVPIEWNSTKKSVEIQTVDMESLKESCIKIKASDGETYSQGSAVAWDYGEFLTAYHAVDEGRTTVTDFGTTSFAVDRYAETLDIAVLKTDSKIKPVKIGDSDDAKVGDKVILISSPNGNTNLVTYCTIKDVAGRITIDTAIGGGSSGGGLFTTNGELIGILISGDDGLKECYITPINLIRKSL
jgi:S1-C subfamily serine protease